MRNKKSESRRWSLDLQTLTNCYYKYLSMLKLKPNVQHHFLLPLMLCLLSVSTLLMQSCQGFQPSPNTPPVQNQPPVIPSLPPVAVVPTVPVPPVNDSALVDKLIDGMRKAQMVASAGTNAGIIPSGMGTIVVSALAGLISIFALFSKRKSAPTA